MQSKVKRLRRSSPKYKSKGRLAVWQHPSGSWVEFLGRHDFKQLISLRWETQFSPSFRHLPSSPSSMGISWQVSSRTGEYQSPSYSTPAIIDQVASFPS